ncbi:four helix bundle protein [Pedobacter sp. CFBP9032]|uniref:four helix bundle protein n=1 Tax=Pedobacter sp. CFBP9032 TaxID=3096539 RepID=UPI001D2993FA|nr:four helix bundle protein [Pedobacter sp. CFBP9032]MDY0905765.1 four helix bundle protein [Pedobacter sp. CFBP9032]NTD95607.1 four helix bundle protein [Agrobacterium tumefaciens]NTE21386.1 four helix bundle protein [Agrobacterium tumefaciens]
MENVSKVDFVTSIKARTKQFVLGSIKFYQTLPKTEEGKIIGRQFIRSASSVGANYRAACRSRSRAEFFSKLSIVVEEADETAFWIEILIESKITNSAEAQPLLKEVNEILAIVAKARKTVSNNK